jgi:hypothetical protein
MFLSAITVGSEKSENKSQISNLKSKLANKHTFFLGALLVSFNLNLDLKSQPTCQPGQTFFIASALPY